MKKISAFVLALSLLTLISPLAYANSGDFTGAASASGFIPTGSTPPTDGLYLPGASLSGIADNSNPVVQFSGVSSGVDYWQFTNSATGSPATETLQATGSDTNIIAKVQGKGTGGVQLTGTSTNDNAPAGMVGEYIYADSGNPVAGTVTITIASPAVITWTSHPFSMNSGTLPIFFTTTGSLPTGITANTTYWIIPSSLLGNTFKIATSIANAFAGTAVNTSGSQSGTHSALPGVAVPAPFFNVAAISLTPGDWDACGTVMMFPDNSSTTVAGVNTQISSSSATNQGFTNGGMTTYWPFTWTGAGGLVLITPTGCGRISLASTITYYLVAAANISAGTMHAYGFIGARRVR